MRKLMQQKGLQQEKLLIALKNATVRFLHVSNKSPADEVVRSTITFGRNQISHVVIEKKYISLTESKYTEITLDLRRDHN